VFRKIKIALWSVGALLLMAAPAMAQGTTVEFLNSQAIGVGLVIIGGASGIGKLAVSALEGMARQPEVAGNIQTAMIIAAALIEGATLFALVILPSGGGAAAPVTVALNGLSGGIVQSFNTQMAGAFVAALPTLIVYVLFGEQFAKGVAS